MPTNSALLLSDMLLRINTRVAVDAHFRALGIQNAQRASFTKAIASGDYESVGRLSLRFDSRAVNQADKLHAQLDDLTELSNSIADFPRQSATRSTLVLQAIQEGFSTAHNTATGLGVPRATADEIFGELRHVSVASMLNQYDRAANSISTTSLESVDHVIGIRAGNLLALAISTFERASAEADGDLKTTAHSKTNVVGLKALRKLRLLVRRWPATISSEAQAISQECRDALEAASLSCARTVLSDRITSASAARQSLAAGNSIRVLLLATTAAMYIESVGHSPKRGSEVRTWRNASLLPFGRVADGGRALGLQCVEGVLTDLNIKHVAGVPISRGIVTTATGEKVAIGLKHIKLDSGGAAVGSAIRVWGLAQESIEWLNGEAALLVARDSPGKHKNESWSNWLRWRLAKSFQMVSHNLAIEFGWKPGHPGASNPLRYGVWREHSAIGGYRSPYAGL